MLLLFITRHRAVVIIGINKYCRFKSTFLNQCEFNDNILENEQHINSEDGINHDCCFNILPLAHSYVSINYLTTKIF